MKLFDRIMRKIHGPCDTFTPMELPKIKEKKQTPAPEIRCHLTVRLTDGVMLSWTNTSWAGVAKEFYAWYFGRPESKMFRMIARDPKFKKPSDTLIIRERIATFGTHWEEKK